MSEREYNPYAAPSRDDEQPPPASEGKGPTLASLMQRFAGALVDGGITVAVAISSLVVWQATKDPNYFALIDTPGFDDLGSFIVFLLPWLLMAIAQWTLISFSGQSIGKRVVGIRIVRLRGSKPGFVYGVLLRAWVPAAFNGFATFLLAPAGFVLPLIDALFVLRADRRSLRDHMAATKVIQVEVRR